jgi:ligand-binding sensor domain-containing protein/DNA-binding CsgD family transcriptional regulator
MFFNKKPFRIFLVILFILAGSSFLFGQFNFEKIDKKSGLSHNSVECIVQDQTGFMWFGTRNGLCRYDGYQIKVFRKTASENSISGNRILSLAEDKNGFLWVGTYQNGLNKFDPKNDSFKHYGEKEHIGNQVYVIKVLKNGTVCVGSSNGLALYNDSLDRFKYFVPTKTKYSINSFLVSDILETRNGEIYIATWNNDIQRFDPATKRFYSIPYHHLEPVTNYRKHIIEDPKGNLWIAAQHHGLVRYNLKTKQSTVYKKEDNALNTDVLTGKMIVSPSGNIWLATDMGGINVYHPKTGKFSYITHRKGKKLSLPSNHIYSLFVDRENRIWAGSFDKGVAYYDPLMNKFTNPFLPQTVYSTFASKSVISLLQDKKGTIWAGTDGHGLYAIDTNMQITIYHHHEKKANSLSSDVITCLGEDFNGDILVGTYMGGLNVIHPQNGLIRHYEPKPNDKLSIHSENVWSILTGSDNKIWLGLLGNGADIFYPLSGNFINIGPFSNQLIKIGHPNVMALMEDADGDIWFGTEGAGIYIYDKQAAKVIRLTPDAYSDVVKKGVIRDLFQDSQGKIWIATEGSGLLRYNKGTRHIRQYTENDGLPEMITLGIQEDQAGNIWVSTYNGLALLNKKTDRFTAFFDYDGLSSSEFNAHSFIRLHNGSFVLGSANGIDLFDPMTLRFNQNLPKVVFTKLKILNKEVCPGDTINKKVILKKDISYTQQITLTPADKIFSLEFAALNYTHPQKCQYQYKLDGFDDQWFTVDSQHRFASYSNLPSGNYTLKVKASNNDGKWGDNLATLHINVLPPFWKTFWFIGSSSLLLLGVVLLFYLQRLKVIRNQFEQEKAINEKRILELEKENIETELHKLTYYTLNRNRVLVSYKKRLLTLSHKAKESVKQGLSLVIDEIDKEIDDDKEWNYIEPQLDKFYNHFISRLRKKHPDLTLSEIKVATYVRMNLTSKEISEIMHKTNRAIENDRYRLRKKIHLDSNESLQQYLLNL